MTKDILIKGIIFVAGAAVGSVVTWTIVKTKYEKIAHDEIESVREVYSERYSEKESDAENDMADEEDELDRELFNESIEKAKEIASQYGYTYSSEREEKKEEETDMEKPYVIRPEEFGEEGYPCISLTYHTDGIVSNDRGKIIANTAELIGKDFASHFGEYEDDSVFIRNDAMQIDYEILKDYKAYSEIN